MEHKKNAYFFLTSPSTLSESEVSEVVKKTGVDSPAGTYVIMRSSRALSSAFDNRD